MSGNFDFRPSQLDAFVGTGRDLIPLHAPDARDDNGREIAKAPCKSKWRVRPGLTVADAKVHMESGKNVGVRLTNDDLVLDVDPRNGGKDSLAALLFTLGHELDDYPTVETGGGGWHIYMRKPVDLRIVNKLDKYPGVEFKTSGTQVVAPGSVHPTGKCYVWDPLSSALADVGDAPPALLTLIEAENTPYAAGLGGTCSPEDLEDLLDKLDPRQFDSNATWFPVMASSHHATNGCGREVFINWSIGDLVFRDDSDVIGKRWDSLSNSKEGRKYTEKTLFKILRDAGHGETVNRITARTDFDDVDETVDDSPSTDGQSDVATRFVWVADSACFVRRSDTKRFSEREFKSLFAGAWKEGDILNAIWRDKMAMKKFESAIYLPWESEVIVNDQGDQFYNFWRDWSIPPKSGDVSIFLEHMAYLLPDEAECELAIDYLALLVAKPAVKMKFAMLFKGRQGTGKSWLGSLITKIIGARNVSTPSNSVVIEKYTDWQNRAQLAIIEELMTGGSFDVANRLKPAITDDFLNIRALYAAAYTVPNRLNFLCFTNHDDALPIESGDRRWMVFFSPAMPACEAYYSSLFAFLDGDGPASVAYYLGKREVKLNPNGVAPMTKGKAEMRALSLGDLEQHLSELLASRAAPFDFGLVRLDDVLAVAPDKDVRQAKNLRNRIIKWMTDEAAANKLPRYTKGGGRPAVQLWSIDDHQYWTDLGAAACNDAYHEHHS